MRSKKSAYSHLSVKRSRLPIRPAGSADAVWINNSLRDRRGATTIVVQAKAIAGCFINDRFRRNLSIHPGFGEGRFATPSTAIKAMTKQRLVRVLKGSFVTSWSAQSSLGAAHRLKVSRAMAAGA